MKTEVAEVVKETPAPKGKDARKRKMVLLSVGLAALLVIAGGGFFAFRKFTTPPPPPPAPAAKAKASTAPPAAATAATAPATAGAAKAGPTPSDTLNKLAHMPAAAINKAQDAIAARKASGQTDVDFDTPAAGGGEKPAVAPPVGATKSPGSLTKTSTGMTSIGRGVSATTEVEAAVEASPAFRSFVANAKISGVFQGSPSRAFINGRLARAGETVDANLGVMFDSVDTERRQLVFRDKAGAIVSRKY